MSSSIPGLVSITEEPGESGGARFVFEIEDDKVEQFFAAFGLQPGDNEGFQRIVIESIQLLLDRQNERQS